VTPMTDSKSQNDKAEESTKAAKEKKPLEYRRFEKMLKQVLKAPPMRKRKRE
jgi:hypothetical protein